MSKNKKNQTLHDVEPQADSSVSGNRPESVTASYTPDLLWLISAGLITLLAAFLRFFWLDLRPLHHDEGVNGHFLTTLFREGVYHYDPSNYHGPDLYYLALAFTKVLGLNTLGIRLSVAVFGLMTVVLAFYLRGYIGKIGSLAAAFFLAVSPGMVFISRYFIHEILFIFLSLSIVVAVLLFFEKEKAGTGAAVWFTLLMAMSFMPATVMGVSAITGRNQILLWSLWAVLLLTEAVLIFFVTRLLMQWRGGRPVYLILASSAAALLFTTKETAFITLGTMLIAVACVFVWRKLLAGRVLFERRKILALGITVAAALGAIAATATFYGKIKEFLKAFYFDFAADQIGQTWLFYIIFALGVATVLAWLTYILEIGKADGELEEPGNAGFQTDVWGRYDTILVTASVVFAFVYLLVLFFTSFFHYPADFWNFFSAYTFWAKTGSTDHTQSGYAGYLKWMLRIESPLVYVSILGTLFAVVKGKHKFALFAGLWAFGLFLAYSIISYKTPWLALSFTLPMCIAGGYAVNELVGSRSTGKRVLGVVVSILSAAVLTYQTYDLNFVRYDDEKMPYVYAHTRRGFNDLIREAKYYAEKSGKGNEAAIEIVTDEYWPMPWYFNDFPNARFHGKLADSNTSEVIIASKKQVAELPMRYSRHYKYIDTYPLRPGVELYLLVRNDLAGPEGKSLYEIEP